MCVSSEQESNPRKSVCSPEAAERASAVLEERSKPAIPFQLFHAGTHRLSDVERAIPRGSQRMLWLHLPALERDRLVRRTGYPEVPPRVEDCLPLFGRGLRPVLHDPLRWAAKREENEVHS